MKWLIYGMIYLGSALMIYNIIGFIRFARSAKRNGNWKEKNAILYIPVILLIFFFLGYLGVGIFGNPDLLVSGILFGGSIFVFIVYQLINRITRRIYEQERLKAELNAAESNSQMKTDILASLSHEMRTPMNVILGLSKITIQDPGLSDEVQGNLKKIIRSGEHLLQLINNILDLNQMEAGELVAGREEFRMENLIQQVSDVGELFCEEKELQFCFEKGADTDGWFVGDPVLLTQSITALLDNAAKYTDAPGTVTFRAECEGEENGKKTFCFTVSDTGVGIDEEFLPKIYDLFSREDYSETNRFGGSGIGLPATKKKIDLMGGEIFAESKKNEGTTFIIKVPLEILEKEESGLSPADLVPLAGRRILIVEDIKENAEILEDLLELEEAVTEHAENGQVALDMYSSAPEYYYDAILMDLRMPILGGVEAAKKIREMERNDAKNVPIIAVTANAFESDVRQTLDAGMNAHLAKPVDADELYRILRHYITQQQMNR